jgi:hypothetical protein
VLTSQEADEIRSRWESELHQTVFALGVRYRRNPRGGQELQNETYLALFDGDRTWNRERYPTAKDFVLSVARSICSHTRRAARAKHRGGWVDGLEDTEPSSKPNPQELLEMKQEHAEGEGAVAKLDGALEGEEDARKVLRLFAEGVDDLDAQATELGQPPEATKKLRRRVRDVARKIFKRKER